jgi:hypothetical protein
MDRARTKPTGATGSTQHNPGAEYMKVFAQSSALSEELSDMKSKIQIVLMNSGVALSG